MHYARSLYILMLLLPLMVVGCKEYGGTPFTEDDYNVVFEIDRLNLAFTIENPKENQTRMSSYVTQAVDNTDFRGICDLSLMPFNVSRTGSDCITASDNVSSSPLEGINGINSGITNNDANTPNQLYGGANSKYFLRTQLPVTTNSFLVYGRAIPQDASTDLAKKQVNGSLTPAGIPGRPAGISFSPVPMVRFISEGHAASAKGDNLITYLNTIFTNEWTNPEKPILNNLISLLQDMKAGSSASVLAFVQEIYELLKPSVSTSYVGDVLKVMLNVSTLPATLPAANTITLPDNCKGFPADCGLPDGAAVIEWAKVNNVYQFRAVTNANNLSTLNTDVTQFVFPAELWYRANSRIHTSVIPLTNPEAQAKTIFNRSSWADVLGQTISQGSTDALFTANGTVQSSTTVVAITDPLQYAVGRLDVKVKADNTESYLVDAIDLHHSPSELKITGVLIGQQSPVDFAFHSKWTTGATEYVIYDNQLPANQYLSTDESETFHTLVLETPANRNVNIAVEFENVGSQNIYTCSENTIVPPGCRFYLIGQLDPTQATNYSSSHNKVFTQDEITSVTFTVNTLANGYYVVPSLSSSELKLGLGVIDWKFSSPTSTALK